VSQIRELAAQNHYTTNIISKMFDISRTHARDIIRRRVWTHLP
jgi:hypothetical protein